MSLTDQLQCMMEAVTQRKPNLTYQVQGDTSVDIQVQLARVEFRELRHRLSLGLLFNLVDKDVHPKPKQVNLSELSHYLQSKFGPDHDMDIVEFLPPPLNHVFKSDNLKRLQEKDTAVIDACISSGMETLLGSAGRTKEAVSVMQQDLDDTNPRPTTRRRTMPPTLGTCGICATNELFESEESTFFCGSDRTHRCCMSCYKDYILSCISGTPKVVPVGCIDHAFHADSQCLFEASEQLIKSLLTEDQFEQYLDASLEVARATDLVDGKVVELHCRNCGLTVEASREEEDGVPVVLLCVECGQHTCTGCAEEIDVPMSDDDSDSESDEDSEYDASKATLRREQRWGEFRDRIEWHESHCIKEGVHDRHEAALDLGTMGEEPTESQTSDLLTYMLRKIHEEIPHCPKCNRPSNKDDGGCNMMQCECGQEYCFVCSKAFYPDGSTYLRMVRDRPQDTAFMMYEDGEAIEENDEGLCGTLHQLGEHWNETSLTGANLAYTHIWDNPRGNGRLCPHNLGDYWVSLGIADFHGVQNDESKCASIYINICTIRALRSCRAELGEVRFDAAFSIYPHRNDPVLIAGLQGNSISNSVLTLADDSDMEIDYITDSDDSDASIEEAGADGEIQDKNSRVLVHATVATLERDVEDLVSLLSKYTVQLETVMDFEPTFTSTNIIEQLEQLACKYSLQLYDLYRHIEDSTTTNLNLNLSRNLVRANSDAMHRSTYDGVKLVSWSAVALFASQCQRLYYMGPVDSVDKNMLVAGCVLLDEKLSLLRRNLLSRKVTQECDPSDVRKMIDLLTPIQSGLATYILVNSR